MSFLLNPLREGYQRYRLRWRAGDGVVAIWRVAEARMPLDRVMPRTPGDVFPPCCGCAVGSIQQVGGSGMSYQRPRRSWRWVCMRGEWKMAAGMLEQSVVMRGN